MNVAHAFPKGLKAGDTVEVCTIWLSGAESPEMFTQWKIDVAEVLSVAPLRYNLGPVIWTEKKPGEPRVPQVPNNIQGPDVRLLVGEAVILGLRLSTRNAIGFVHDLEPKDHALLRRITKRKYAEQYPHYAPLNDRQADTLINDLGPQAAIDTLKGLRRTDLH